MNRLKSTTLCATVMAVAITVSAFMPSYAVADDVKFWIRAFIPNAHPKNPSYVIKHPTASNKWVIPAPSFGFFNMLVDLISSVPTENTCNAVISHHG